MNDILLNRISNPSTPWQKRVIAAHVWHRTRQQPWSINDSAKVLGLSYSMTSALLRLGRAMLGYTGLQPIDRHRLYNCSKLTEAMILHMDMTKLTLYQSTVRDITGADRVGDTKTFKYYKLWNTDGKHYIYEGFTPPPAVLMAKNNILHTYKASLTRIK